MAYIDPTQDPNAQQNNATQVDQVFGNSQNAQPTQSPQAPTTGSGGGGANAGGPQAPGSGNNTGSQASGTAVSGNNQPTAAQQNANAGWTNLDKYLNANSDQASKMGQDIAGSVNASGTKAQNDIGNLNTGFTQAVQGASQNNLDATNQAIQNATSLKAGQTLNDSDLQGFKNQVTATYRGPTDVSNFDGFNQANQDIANANQQAKQTQSEAGRGVLLNTQYGNASQNGYTLGENNLDQLLLQNSQGAQSALQPLAQQWGGLTGALNQTVASGNQAAAAGAQNTQNIASEARGALGTANQTFQTNLQNQVAQTNTDRALLAQRIQNGQLDIADLKNLGLQDQNWGVDLSKFVTNSPVTAENVVSPDQLAQYQALQQLAGTYDPTAVQNMFAGANPSDLGKAPSEIDSAGYLKAVSDAQNAVMKTDLGNALSGIANTASNDSLASMINGLQQHLAAGNLTPDQAKQAADAWKQWYIGASAGLTGTPPSQVADSYLAPIYNYYNNEYVPESQQTLVGNMKALPTNPDGSINWGGITAPQGK